MAASKLAPTNAVPNPNGKFPLLLSYALVRHKPEEEFARFVEHPGIEVLLDSGAFTALNTGEEIRLKDYLAFLEKWHDKLFGYLALDVLGNPVGTDTNLQIMRTAGFKPIPVHVRGDNEARMDQLFEWSDYVALGGLRRPHAGWSGPAYVKQKMLWAKGRNVHWLGYTRAAMIRGFRPYSCDCSNWSSGSRWGQVHMFLGDWDWSNRGKSSDGAFNAAFSSRELAFMSEIGITPEQARNPETWRLNVKEGHTLDKHVPFNLTAYAWVKYIRFVRKELGTRLFLACSMIGEEHWHMLRMIERTMP